MSISTFTTFCLVEFLNNAELTLLVAGDDHLCDALTLGDDERLVREVYEQHSNLATIIGVNGARRVEHSYAVLECES